MRNRPKVSVLIPYRNRLANARNAFAALADQTLNGPDLEVVLGAVGYEPEYTAVAAEFADRLDIVTVTSGGEWNVCRARNQGLRAVTGEITVSIDVDMALPPHCLEHLYNEYFAAGQDVCVLGQMLGYDDELTTSDLSESEVRSQPYEHYRQLLARLSTDGVDRPEDRMSVHPLPQAWTLVWGGFAALRTDTVRRHSLTFDENFVGWGAEDQEWGYRIFSAGVPILMREDLWGVHMLHARGATGNRESYELNMRYMLTKWPMLGAELMRTFGWDGANTMWEQARRAVAAVTPAGRTLGMVAGRADGEEVLVLGAALDDGHRPVDPAIAALLGPGPYAQVLPLVGMALPYVDGTFAECRVLEPLQRIEEKFRDAVFREAARVAPKVTAPVRPR